MSNEQRTDVQALPQYVLVFVEKILPRGIREECMDQLRKVCQPVGDWVRQAVATVIGGYRVQLTAGFNKACFVLELAAGIYVFSAAQVPGPVVAVVVPVL